MATLPITIPIADEERVKDAFAEIYPADNITDIADVQAIFVRFALGVCEASEERKKGSDGLATYTPPDIT